MKPMTLFAHRGAKAHAPENTLPAFSLAAKMGAPWIELDVHLVENRLVVIHDDRLERTTNGEGYLWDHPLEEIRAFDAGNGERIPFFEEVLETVNGATGLNVELKGPGTAEAVASALYQALRTSWSQDQFIVSSFFHKELRKFGEIAPEFSRAALTMAVPESLAQFAQDLGCDAVHASIEFVDPDFITDAHDRGLAFRMYTVNHPEEWKRMQSLHVDGVFSDDPTLANTMS